MNITEREAADLLSLLRRIRGEANNPGRKKHSVENMCDLAITIIKKTRRRNDTRIQDADRAAHRL